MTTGALPQGRPWRAPIFGLVDEVRVRRRAGDAVRVATAVVIFLVVAVTAELGDPDDAWFDEAIGVVPDTASWMVTSITWSCSIGMLFALSVIGIAGRRWRLVISLALVAVASAAAGVLLTDLYGDVAWASALPAVAVATSTAVAPYLTRPAARAVAWTAVVCVFASVVGGSVPPVGLLLAVTAGWAGVSVLRLVTGSPVGIPSARRVAAGADALGVPVGALEPVDLHEWGAARFTGQDAGGRLLLITVYGRDAEDASLLSRLWRFVWYRSDGPGMAVKRVEQVEHEALVSVFASRAGATVPGVLVAGMADTTEDALLIADRPAGRCLDDVGDEVLDDVCLDSIWQEQQLLSGSRMAHGCLDGERVLVDERGGAALIDFRRGRVSAPRDARARDVAQLLTTVAMRVGPERAVASARRNVTTDELVAAIQQLQPAAFAGGTRRALRHHRSLVKELRQRTAAECGVDVPELADLRRLSLTDVAIAVGTLVGFWMLIGQLSGIGDIGDVVADAVWAWVLVAFLISQTTNFAQAYALTGSVASPLPFGPVVGLQFGLAFTGLVGGTVANTATIIRFFQRRGLTASIAVSSGVLVSVASSVVQALLFVGCYFFVRSDFTWGSTGSDGSGESGTARLVLLLLVGGGLLVGVVALVPRFRRSVVAKVKPQIAGVRSNLRDLAADPRQTSRLFIGNLAAQVLFALTLGASLEAYGAKASLAALIVVNTVASLIGGIAPVPGGMGVVEAGLIAGFTAYGIPLEQATAAVFTSRLFTAYLPPVWGWPSLAWLRRHDYL